MAGRRNRKGVVPDFFGVLVAPPSSNGRCVPIYERTAIGFKDQFSDG